MFRYLKELILSRKEINPNEEDESVDNVGASVTFYVQEGEPKVDISVADYSQESVKDLTTLLIGLTGSLFFAPTMEMVKDGLLSESEHEILLKIMTSLAEMKTLERQSIKEKEEPCIKPQDVI